MIVMRSPKGWTGPKTVDGLKTEGYWRSHQVTVWRHAKARARQIARRMDEELSAARVVRRRGQAEARDRGAGAGRRAANERQSACQWRAFAARTGVAGFCRLRRRDSASGPDRRRGDPDNGHVLARHYQTEPKFSAVRPGRNLFEPVIGGVRGHRPTMGRRNPARRRSSG